MTLLRDDTESNTGLSPTVCLTSSLSVSVLTSIAVILISPLPRCYNLQAFLSKVIDAKGRYTSSASLRRRHGPCRSGDTGLHRYGISRGIYIDPYTGSTVVSLFRASATAKVYSAVHCSLVNAAVATTFCYKRRYNEIIAAEPS
jgi:hypothetical protein